MRILFIGGTRFVGRAMAEAALAAGHQVTVLHRGATDDSVVELAEHLHADRDGDLRILADREFDATVDVCGYVPRQVDALAAALEGRGGHHVFVSTMSVYADADGPGIDESARLTTLDDPSTEQVTAETYGGLKVRCEEQAEAAYGDTGLAIVRPTYVIGPHDHTGRFTWWVRRIARGGEVLAPGPYDAPMQVIDARDQGEWVVKLCEKQTSGVFNSVSPTPPFGFGDLLDATVRAVGPDGTELTWAGAEWLSEQGETYRSLPLWAQGEKEWTLAAEPTKAIAAGLTPRALTETISDTWQWIKQDQPPPVPGWGVSSGREAELLASWHARAAST